MTLSELRAIAEKATPGPWSWPSRWNGRYSVEGVTDNLPVIICTMNGNFDWCKPTAEFVAAANPAVVLELLERLEAMEKALVAYGVCGCRGKPYKCLLCSSLDRHGSAVPLKGEK